MYVCQFSLIVYGRFGFLIRIKVILGVSISERLMQDSIDVYKFWVDYTNSRLVESTQPMAVTVPVTVSVVPSEYGVHFAILSDVDTKLLDVRIRILRSLHRPRCIYRFVSCRCHF